MPRAGAEIPHATHGNPPLEGGLPRAGQLEAGFSTSQATDLYHSLRKAAGGEAARHALRRLYPTPVSVYVDALELAAFL